MPRDIHEYILETIEKPNGIFIVTGPTGSGKTTTLYACLNKINTIDSKLLTAEDPVEYEIDGIMQVPVNEGIGLTFAKVLRAFLRQDPDRIMIGETRDLETATDRHPGLAHRSPCLHHAPHQRLDRSRLPPGGHGSGALHDFRLAGRRACPAACPPHLHQVPKRPTNRTKPFSEGSA